MFDTNEVTQKRDSNLDTDINRIEEQYLQITEGLSKSEVMPNTSQGFRLRNSGVGATNQPIKSSAIDKMGLSSFLNDGKKSVQTAQSGKRVRRQIMAKSQTASDNGMAGKIEANKYMTNKDVL